MNSEMRATVHGIFKKPILCILPEELRVNDYIHDVGFVISEPVLDETRNVYSVEIFQREFRKRLPAKKVVAVSR